MAIQKAIIARGPGDAGLVSDHVVPELRPSYLKVKVEAVALNPTDWKGIAKAPEGSDFLIGCDYAGTVEATGEGYDKQWKVGDRIAGMAHGLNKLQKNDGAFAEHILVKADVQLRVPDTISFEDASTLGVGWFTCVQGLFQALKLNSPDSPSTEGEYVLIYGGSTATGALGIQYARLAGYKVITTCSPRNFDYVKSLGVTAVFDYKDSASVQKINDLTGGRLSKVWDTVSVEQSARFCADVIAPNGHYAAILPIKSPRDDVENHFTLAYTVYGEPVEKPYFKKEDNRADFELAKKFAVITEKLLAEGKLKPHRAKVSSAGLAGVMDGLDLLKNDKVSGEKLVYTF